MTTFELGPGAEFDRIRDIAKRLGASAAGLGDDAAVISMGDTKLVASIDCSVEGVHFRTDWLSFEEIGARAAGAALSDLAAEGARPIGVLVSVGGSGARDDERDPLLEIMSGVGTAVESVGGKVLGGDLVKSDRYLVDVCVLGETRNPITRAGARPGDGIWVTGNFGGCGAALEALLAGKKPRVPHRAKFARPSPRVAAGRWLADHGARAMIDVSDGLAGDLEHLAAASGVALGVDGDRVPLAEGVAALAALSSGEEYELAVALPADFTKQDAERFLVEIHVRLTRIGEVKAGAGVEITLGGKRVQTPPGFDHFRK